MRFLGRSELRGGGGSYPEVSLLAACYWTFRRGFSLFFDPLDFLALLRSLPVHTVGFSRKSLDIIRAAAPVAILPRGFP